MKFSNIVFEEIDKVARITFNRLDVRNALNLELLGEMIQVVEYLSKNDKIRALIHNRAAESKVYVAAEAAGLRSMRADGQRLIDAGITSPEEVMSVTRD